MKNQKPKSKPETVANKRASGGRCASPCSAWVRIPVHIGGKNVGWMELKPDTEKSLAKATMGHKVNPTASLAIRVDTMEIVEVDLCWSPGIALSELEAKYQELLGAVESKHDGETRHQTAIRYLTERETRNAEAGQVS